MLFLSFIYLLKATTRKNTSEDGKKDEYEEENSKLKQL